MLFASAPQSVPSSFRPKPNVCEKDKLRGRSKKELQREVESWHEGFHGMEETETEGFEVATESKCVRRRHLIQPDEKLSVCLADAGLRLHLGLEAAGGRLHGVWRPQLHLPAPQERVPEQRSGGR